MSIGTAAPRHRWKGWARRAATVGVCLYLLLCAGLFLAQGFLIYHPVPRAGLGPTFGLDADGVRLVVSYSRPPASPRAPSATPALVYFGGNGEDVSQAVPQLARAFPAAAVYALHYRGYGGSQGRPSEAALVADGERLFDLVARRHAPVTVVGRSLGSGVAVQVATVRPGRVARLVLVTPFDSLVEVAARHLPVVPVRWLLTERYESWRYAQQLSVPTTLVVAADDRLVPPARARRLLAAFPAGVARLIVLPDVGHNDVSFSTGYLNALRGQAGTQVPAGPVSRPPP